MDCTLQHSVIGGDGAFGTLFRQDIGTQIAVTLEHAYDDGGGGWFSKIPPGRYFCVLGHHPINGVTYEVTNVPGHTAMLFHVGNYEKDSAGCILLGEQIDEVNGRLMITKSRETFEKFMALQDGTPSFWLWVDQATA